MGVTWNVQGFYPCCWRQVKVREEAGQLVILFHRLWMFTLDEVLLNNFLVLCKRSRNVFTGYCTWIPFQVNLQTDRVWKEGSTPVYASLEATPSTVWTCERCAQTLCNTYNGKHDGLTTKMYSKEKSNWKTRIHIWTLPGSKICLHQGQEIDTHWDGDLTHGRDINFGVILLMTCIWNFDVKVGGMSWSICGVKMGDSYYIN